MTFCKVLASAQRGEDTVTAYVETNNCNAVETYCIVVSRDGIARLVQPTARTTWRKRFKEMAGI